MLTQGNVSKWKQTFAGDSTRLKNEEMGNRISTSGMKSLSGT